MSHDGGSAFTVKMSSPPERGAPGSAFGLAPAAGCDDGAGEHAPSRPAVIATPANANNWRRVSPGTAMFVIPRPPKLGFTIGVWRQRRPHDRGSSGLHSVPSR